MSDSEETSRPAIQVPNRAARRAAGMRSPLAEGAPDGIGKGLSQLFQKKDAPYMPVLKALETIGIDPKMMEVMIGEKPVQCIVIPTQDLVYKEWQYMTNASFALEPLGEEQKDD